MKPPLFKAGEQLVFEKGTSLRSMNGKRDRSKLPGVTQGIVSFSLYLGETWYYSLQDVDKSFVFCEDDIVYMLQEDEFVKTEERETKEKEMLRASVDIEDDTQVRTKV